MFNRDQLQDRQQGRLMNLYDGWPFPREGKRCSYCKQTKLFTEFCRNRTKRDGFQDYCNECRCALARKAYARDPQVINERNKRWKAANPAKFREMTRKTMSKGRNGLADWYVRKLLKDSDLIVAPDTMALKRAQLQLTRSLKCTTT